MTDGTPTPEATWRGLKPDSIHALQTLLGSVNSDSPAEEVFEAYLWAKKVLAQAMHARLQMHLPPECPVFWELRKKIGDLILGEYSGKIPAKYLKVPYGSTAHVELFATLLDKIGNPVEAAMLRIATEDSVHTERRMRELRELGFDITSAKSNGVDVYTLRSLDIDTSKTSSIIQNLIKKDKSLPNESLRQELLTIVSNR